MQKVIYENEKLQRYKYKYKRTTNADILDLYFLSSTRLRRSTKWKPKAY